MKFVFMSDNRKLFLKLCTKQMWICIGNNGESYLCKSGDEKEQCEVTDQCRGAREERYMRRWFPTITASAIVSKITLIITQVTTT